MLNNPEKFIQANSPDGGFLQSSEWRKFQAVVGRKTYNISADGFWANVIEHSLPVVGKYFYAPRGPVVQDTRYKIQDTNKSQNSKSKIENGMQELIDLAEENKTGWIRIELASEEILEKIKNNIQYKITKAPHDVQPKEIFIVDIAKTEEEFLAEMKSKTRYNIKLAEKKGVSVRAISNPNDKNTEKYIAEFLRLVRITAKRDGITSHPESYYRKMLEIIPGDILKLYIAEYQGKVIVANLVLFYGETCTYMHGASDDEYRNVMAPYILQWQQIKDAKKAGCRRYDFGGVSTNYESSTNVRITNIAICT